MIEEVGDQITSIESSVAIFEDRAYFANGLGRVVGLDIARVHQGVAPVVFDFWAGDDIDASIVIDTAGMLYVAAELERFLPRAREVGQLFKLDPTRPDDPIVWGIPIPAAVGDVKGGGIWSTPALGDGVLYVTTQSGRLMVVDSQSGEIAWEEQLTRHLWASPVVVDDELLVATCEGELRAYSVAEPRTPRLQWSLRVGGRRCIESTPAVWRGRIFVGTWSGYFFAVGDAPLATTVGARVPGGARTGHTAPEYRRAPGRLPWAGSLVPIR